MKKVILYFILLVLTAVSIQAQKSIDTFMVQVDGLGCPFCAYGLEKKFKEFKGIKNVKINIETGDFSFTYPSEKNLSLAAVNQQVEKAGYTPITAKIKRADGTVEELGALENNSTYDQNIIEQGIMVSGNCNQCRARIEKAAQLVTGVRSASWQQNTKMLSVAFDAHSTAIESIEKAVAEVGHDTENHKAHTNDYGQLPTCCKYKRLKK